MSFLARPILAWALYDFANTMFSMNVVSLHGALWVVRDLGGRELHYSLVYGGAMLFTIALAPALGRMADLGATRRASLALWTGVCILSTAAMGFAGSLAAGLSLFFAANVAYQLSLVFYDSLLAGVAPPNRLGWVSGFGVALGYAGALAGIVLTAPFVNAPGGGVIRQRAFVPTALLYFLFALPCLIWVRDKGARGSLSSAGLRPNGPKGPEGPRRGLWRESLEALRRTPSVRAFLLTMFLIQNAANTVILFMGIYASEVAGFRQAELHVFFALTTVAALAGSVTAGRLSDRLGPRTVLGGVIALWLVALMLAAAAGQGRGLWIAGVLMGVALGGLWTASRPLLLALVPEREAATFFGFNVLAGRFSAIVGPLLWGGLVSVLEPWGALRYRAAVGALGLLAAAALITLRHVPDAKPA